MAAWEWKAEDGDCVLGSLNHEYVAALEKASARLVEIGPMTPPPPGEVAPDALWQYEEGMVIGATVVSDEGEEDVSGQHAMTDW
jgi:hypothetical protein